jgi:type VI secretion system protein VasG
MEKQALLEDIAIGNQCHAERLSEIEQEEVRQIVTLDELKPVRSADETHRAAAKAVRIYHASVSSQLQQELNEMQQQPADLLDVNPHRCQRYRLDRRAVVITDEDEQTELLSLENEIGKRVGGQDVALRLSPDACVRQNRPYVRKRSVGRIPVGRSEWGKPKQRCAPCHHVRRREVTHYD